VYCVIVVNGRCGILGGLFFLALLSMGGGGLVAVCRCVVHLIYVVLEYPGVCCGIVGVCLWCLDVRVPRSSVALRNEQIFDLRL
jgi:hypothetical protein